MYFLNIKIGYKLSYDSFNCLKKTFIVMYVYEITRKEQ